MIAINNIQHHWNYFIALEEDLLNIARYIEFEEGNLDTYSIELAHLLFSSSSEIDVLLKSLCKIIDGGDCGTIGGYRKIIQKELPEIINETIYIKRYGMELHPWESWNDKENETHPFWWNAYNKVKHHRDSEFNKANLKNVINSIGALFIINLYFYMIHYSNLEGKNVSIKDSFAKLHTEPKLFSSEYDKVYLII